jgi:hypothetical protein
MREERKKVSIGRRVERRPYAEKPKQEDDIASWVNKSRKLDEQKKLEEKKKAARMAAILAEQVGFSPFLQSCCCMQIIPTFCDGKLSYELGIRIRLHRLM